MKIGFITAEPDVLKIYFPTREEPDFLPTEPPFTPDDQILVNHLRHKYKINIAPVVWGCPIESIIGFDALVIRSPWDYMDSADKRDAFFKWINKIRNLDIRIFNSPQVLNWLLDKHYLKDFKRIGIKIVPTEFVEKGDSINLEEIFDSKGPFIAKPCISAAGIGLRYIKDKQTAIKEQIPINAELKTVGFMVQDFIEEIKTEGEWSLIFFGGEYSHSLLKKPAEGNILVQGEYGGSLSFNKAPDEIINFGTNVISNIPKAYKLSKDGDIEENILYIRVDIISSKGKYYLSELEGVEPELFFRAKPGSEDIFSQKLLNALKKPI